MLRSETCAWDLQHEIQRLDLASLVVGWAVRSNKRAALSSLFRHSIMAVVDEGGIFPPDFTRWQGLVGCFSEPALLGQLRGPHRRRGRAQ